jgi:APA family basic amino acid/polyamine antiporter
VFWFDGDTVALRKFSADDLARTLPAGVYSSYLGRKGYHCESGFLAFDASHLIHLASMGAWERFYTDGAIAGLSSVILVMLLGQPRIFYTMAKDGLLPPVFAVVHPKFRTPWVASALTGVAAMTFAGLLPIGLLGELVSIGTLLAFAIVCAGVLVLRYTDPNIPRPFKTPWVPFVPLGGIGACLYLMLALPVDTWARLIVWMGLGLAIYFLYGRRHSKVQQAAR